MEGIKIFGLGFFGIFEFLIYLIPVAIIAGLFFSHRKTPKSFEDAIYGVYGLLSLNVILWIVLMFFRISKIQGTIYVFLIAMLFAAVIAYYFKSSGTLILAMVELISLIILQYVAFIEAKDELVSPGFLAFYLLLVGVILYGLSLIHRAMQHKFGRVFQEWSAFYLLLFSYILSFQALLPYLWPRESISSTGAISMLFIMAVLSIAALVIGVMGAVSTRSIENREIVFFIAFVLLLSILIWSTSFVSDSDVDIFRRVPISSPLFYVWLFSNVIFIGIILAVIGYGAWQKAPKIINLGIFFFAIDIVTRYIGFVMDYKGYTTLAVIFITGGIVLLVGGYGIERWRRNLIGKARVESSPVIDQPLQAARVRRR